jgi:hypothetical protein
LSDPARIAPGVGDQFLQRADRQGGVNREGECVDDEEGDRFEILDRIVRRAACDRVDHQRPTAAEQKRVAVRQGAGDRGGPERTAGAADVFDHHRAEQQFHHVRPRTGDGIECAAWGNGTTSRIGRSG